MAAPPQVLASAVLPGAGSSCPPYPEETAERYVMRWMTAEEAHSFECHLAHCPPCVQAVSELQMFAGILRAALNEARA